VHLCALFPWPGQNMLSSELGVYSILVLEKLEAGGLWV